MKINILPLFFLISICTQAQTLRINEVMADNESSIADSNGEYSDWIELYNYGMEPIFLGDFYLSDSKNDFLKWALPEVELLPDSYFLVFCTGDDYNIGMEWHTNFRIASKGEMLYLSDEFENIIDALPDTPLSDDVSFGKDSNGLNVKQSKPTPLGPNCVYTNTLSFSHPDGCYDNSFALEVSSDLAHQVHYLRGSGWPSTVTEAYDDPITISPINNLPLKYSLVPSTAPQSEITYKAWSEPSSDIPQLQILRFQSFHEGVATSPVYTKVFYSGNKFSDFSDLPVLNLTIDSLDLFDYETGLYTTGIHFDEDKPEWSGNFFERGWEWEKPVHLSYFEEDKIILSQNAGVRIKGEKTRQAAQKSLRLVAREKFGSSTFDHPLISNSDKRFFTSFILRSTMGSWGPKAMMKDEVIQRICKDLDFESMDTELMTVFINGEFWGFYPMRDNIDEQHLAQISGHEKDDIEMFNWRNGHYFDIVKYIETNDVSLAEHYDYVSSQIDVSNLIDYEIAEIFFKNRDWPGNNNTFWRPRTEDGKWRWIFFDLDGSIPRTTEQTDMFDRAINTDAGNKTPFIFKSLLENDAFRNRFIARYLELLDSNFTTEYMMDRLSELRPLYARHFDNHMLRWNFPGTKEEWEGFVDITLVDFFHYRPCIALSELVSYFDLDEDLLCTEEPLSGTALKIYPNPAAGNITIEFSPSAYPTYDLQMFDVLGQRVQVNAIETDRGKLEIDLSSLSQSTYFIRMSYLEQVVVKRISVHY